MLIVISAVAFLASLLTLYSGFGLGTLLMPAAALFFPVATAIALTAFVHLFNNLFKLAVLWRDIHWQVTLKFGLPALLAAVPGAWLLTRLSALPTLASYQLAGFSAEVSAVKLIVGILLILFALAEWAGVGGKSDSPVRYLPWGGVLSGFFGGLSGHQGAFRSAFLLHAGLDPPQFIASNAAIALMVDITRLGIYGLNLSLLMAQVETSLIAAATAAAFAGVLAGKSGLNKVTIGLVRQLVGVLLLVLGGLLAAGII